MKPRRKGLHEGRGGRRETSQAPEGPAEMQKGYSGISLRIKMSTEPPNELEGVAVMTPRVDGTMRSRGPTQASSPRPAFDGEATSVPYSSLHSRGCCLLGRQQDTQKVGICVLPP